MAKIEKPIIETEEECLAGLDERQKIIVNAQTGEQKLVPLDDEDKEYFRKKARAKLVAGENLTEEEAKTIVL